MLNLEFNYRYFPKLIAIILLPFIFCSTINAQTDEIDSLKNVAFNSNDTSKIIALIRLGEIYRRTDTDLAFVRLDEALTLAGLINYKIGVIRASYALGVTNGMIGNYPEALNYINQSLNLATNEGSLKYMGFAYSSLGIVYKRIGDYPKSLEYYKKNLTVVDSLKNIEAIGNVYSNLGVLYDLMKEPDLALEYYNNALVIYKETKNLSGQNVVNDNIGVMHFNNKNYNEALEKFKKGLEYESEFGNKIKICTSNTNLGITYIHLKKYDLAYQHLMTGLLIAEELSLKQEIVNILHNLAELKFKQQELEGAIEYSKRNLMAAQEIESYDLKKQAHQMASRIYQASGDFSKSLDHLLLYQEYKDSLFNENKVHEFERQQVQFEVYKKDRELAQQNLELELLMTRVSLETRLRWVLAISVFLLLILLFLIYKRYTTKNKMNSILKMKNQLIGKQKSEIEDMNVELEKRMLRAQMNPHFIFNSLNSIQHLITNGEKQSALKYLTKFSSLLRQVLESSISINVILAEEIKLLEIYIELEALRFDQNFEYAITIDDKLDVFLNEVPVLLVQPYIENAILHGLMPKEGNRVLAIHFKNSDNFVHCIITDNGIGRTAAATLKSKKNINPSRGMSVTKQRLALLKTKNKSIELVEIEDILDLDGKADGTRVTVNIPKILNN